MELESISDDLKDIVFELSTKSKESKYIRTLSSNKIARSYLSFKKKQIKIIPKKLN